MFAPTAWALLALASGVLAHKPYKPETVTVDWSIDWVEASPDGFTRPVIGINGEWPCPILEANLGDTIVVNIVNNLGNETTGMHWHGIGQYGTPEMDGSPAAAQCPIPPGAEFTYKFKPDKAGTFWYHSHEMGQYPDGLRGPLIIHDPEDPYTGQVDEEIIMTVSDWYHTQSIPLVQAMLQPSNTEFRPPIPDNIILNEGGSTELHFEEGKTYRIRMISFSALAAAFFTFEGYTMEIIMQDGSYVTPAFADIVRLDTAQRYDILLKAKEDSVNTPFLVALDVNPDYTSPETSPIPIRWPFNVSGQVIMDEDASATSVAVINDFAPIDDATITNADGEGPYGPVTQTIEINFNFCFDNYSIPRACFNGQPYVPQLVPTLYTAATVGEANTNPIVYGAVNPFIVESDAVVDIVINNRNFAIHPFHLHGHEFQVIERAPSGAGVWPGTTTEQPQPGKKDVLSVYSNSYAVIRFKADNPGMWLFHCHIEWHVEMGMQASIIEGPDALRGWQFPSDHLDACRIQGIPVAGNAAGNLDPLNTTGIEYVNDPVYTGALYDPADSPDGSFRKRRM